MKKDIGAVLGLYPTPLVVVGAMVEGRANWMLVGHVGIIGHDRILLSAVKAHHTNKGIRENKVLSVNIVTEEILPGATYIGKVSGKRTDKSAAFDFTQGKTGAPLLSASHAETVRMKIINFSIIDFFNNFPEGYFFNDFKNY